MLDPQNFEVQAGNSTTINIDVDPDDGITLVGADIFFRVYEQELGLPVAGVDPVIEKTQAPGGIVVTDSDLQKMAVTLDPADTASLLRNYYWETTIVDTDNAIVTVALGIVTIIGTEYRAA